MGKRIPEMVRSCGAVRRSFQGLMNDFDLSQCVTLIQVAIAAGFHLFPSRTEKLSPPTPMVLP